MVSRYYAVKELLENSVTSLPITTEQIEAIITAKSFKIICYDVSCEEHAEILNNVGVLQLAGRTKAFTYVSKQEKIVFVKIGVSANEKRLLLAHELGHIVMGHISDNGIIGYHPSGLIDEAQEDEANAFALEFLAPVCILSRKHINTPQKVSALTLLDEKRSKLVADEIHNHNKPNNIEIGFCKQFEASEKSNNVHREKIMACIRIILFISAVVIFLSYPLLTHKSEYTKYSDYVVRTKSGEKYHRPNCHYIANSKNVIQVTIEQAKDTGYTPCKDCFPELYD